MAFEIPVKVVTLTAEELASIIESAAERGANNALAKHQPIPNPQGGKEYFSVSEAAAYLSVTVQTVHNWVKSGTLRQVRAGSGKPAFHINDLRAVYQNKNKKRAV